MNVLTQLSQNRLLICALLSWLIAQVIKTVLHVLYYRSFDWGRILGSGGMPSSHSAAVCSLAISCGLSFGFDGFEFALSGIFAVVVMYDACGVRRAAGEHARMLNELGAFLLDADKTPEEKLKEFIGHTPLQVLAGAVLGAIVALIAF